MRVAAPANASACSGVIFFAGTASAAKKPSRATEAAAVTTADTCRNDGRAGSAATAAAAAARAPKTVVRGFFIREVYTVLAGRQQEIFYRVIRSYAGTTTDRHRDLGRGVPGLPRLHLKAPKNAGALITDRNRCERGLRPRVALGTLAREHTGGYTCHWAAHYGTLAVR